ncbi:MAG: tetratricopeptide repeat protein, partial [Spirochaetaceae bacterium]|nr:tetratricopeptide repeat protein [Spirochaetaceae bacterium]
MTQRLCALFIVCFSFCAALKTHAADISLQEAIEESAAAMVEKLPKKTRVAVVAMEAESENLAAYIMDEITGALVGSDIEVADRNNLSFALKELHLQASGLVDDKNAAQVGKFLGANYVVVGQLVHLGSSYRYRLSAINAESAIQEANIRHTVKNNKAFKNMLAALNKNKQVLREAKYAVTESTAPASAGRFLERGIVFAMRGDYKMAVEDFTDAIKLKPDMSSAYMLRGGALFASVSNVISVEANFSGISTIFNNANLGFNVSREQQAVYDQALADFNQTIKLDANSASAYEKRGAVYIYKNDYNKAIADFNQAIKLDPNNASFYNNRGNAYSFKGDYDQAIADFNQAIKLDPNNASFYNNRGGAYYNKEDYDRAIADYNQAIKLNPNFPGAYENRGRAYQNKEDYDKAIADYTQTIKLNPNYAAAYLGRGVAYL